MNFMLHEHGLSFHKVSPAHGIWTQSSLLALSGCLGFQNGLVTLVPSAYSKIPSWFLSCTPIQYFSFVLLTYFPRVVHNIVLNLLLFFCDTFSFSLRTPSWLFLSHCYKYITPTPPKLHIEGIEVQTHEVTHIDTAEWRTEESTGLLSKSFNQIVMILMSGLACLRPGWTLHTGR